jgi:hypothetical protein
MQVKGELREHYPAETGKTKDEQPRTWRKFSARILDDTLDDSVRLTVWGSEDSTDPFEGASKGDTITADVKKYEVYRERLQVTCDASQIQVQVPSGL